MNRRVVVTGIGLVSSLGIGTEPTWDGICQGRSGVVRITRFDTSAFAVQDRGRNPGIRPAAVLRKERSQEGRPVHSVRRGGRPSSPWTMPGLVVGPENATRRRGVHRVGDRRVRDDRTRAHDPDGGRPPQDVAVLHPVGDHQPRGRACLDPASGPRDPTSRPVPRVPRRPMPWATRTTSFAAAMPTSWLPADRRRRLRQLSVGGFGAMRALSTRNDEPHRASRPFDKDRDGFVIGEGAGILDSRGTRACPPARCARSMPKSSATA